MDFLTNLSFRDFGVLGGSGTIIGVTIYYVLKFQTTFTNRLADQNVKDTSEIDLLHERLDKRTTELYLAQNENARLTRKLILNGIDPTDPSTSLQTPEDRS